jgi:hypothetical protein
MRNEYRISPSRCELLALYDGRGISNKQNQPVSLVRSHSSPCHGDNHAQSLSDQGSPVLSIRGENEGYHTPPPDAYSHGPSASPEQNAMSCSDMGSGCIYRTPRAPSIRPIEAPLLEFDDCTCRFDPCILSKAKLDHTFSHLRLCFNNDCSSIQTTVSASGQIPTVASARTTPKKVGKGGCLMQ